MADRKVRSVTFKLPSFFTPKELKEAIDKEIKSKILVFQELGVGEYLIEVEDRSDVDTLIEEGFDLEEAHISCHPPHARLTNVSIMNLRSYIDDEAVLEALKQYGEIKGEVIRLKYKTGHDLAGLENGNRLVKMFLTKKSIPYSLRIAGEWCRVIHNNQQPVCTECNQEGHTRKRCPQVQCIICKEYGHMSYHCVQANALIEEPEQPKSVDVLPESVAENKYVESTVPVVVLEKANSVNLDNLAPNNHKSEEEVDVRDRSSW